MKVRRRAAGGAAALFALAAAPAAVAAGGAIAPGPDNRTFSRGLEGWSVEGRVPVELTLVDGRPRAILVMNTTLVTPPTLVPRGAQAFAVRARAPRARALLVVRALVEGADPVHLGVIEPGARLEEHLVGGLAELGGSTVRFELDPVTALGQTIQIGGVGPFRAPLRGWRVLRGVARPASGRQRFLLDGGDALRATRGVRLAARAAAVSVRLRGDGAVRLVVGGRGRGMRAEARWKTLQVPVTSGSRATRVTLIARPGVGRLEIARPGAVRTRPAQDSTRRA